MRLLVAIGLLLLATLTQSLIGQALPLLPGRPDFPLIIVLAWAILRGSTEGAIVGFIAGILLDSVTYTPFGLNSALLGIAGYLTGLPEANTYRGNLPFFLAAAFVVTLAYHTSIFVVLQALGQAMPPLAQMYAAALPAAVLNALLVAPAFLLCRHLLRALGGWSQLRL